MIYILGFYVLSVLVFFWGLALCTAQGNAWGADDKEAKAVASGFGFVPVINAILAYFMIKEYLRIRKS